MKMFSNISKKIDLVSVTFFHSKLFSDEKMVMTTRYQKKSTVYAEVFENPLLLSIITSSLNEKDLVNFSTTNKKFHPTHSELGCNVIQHELDQYYTKYIKNKEEEQKRETDREFITKLKILFKKQGNRNNLRNTSRVFDHIVKYKDHIMSMKETYGHLLDAIENRLVNFAQSNEGGFAHDALNYLYAIFDISINARAVPDGDGGAPDEYVEYIVTTKGEHVYI